ncbi:MAG: DUF4366 domain-containing protein [Lachnospiraceae bacterium]|nr:DUF4366 domain-containing protein [Lachnospiraceae bacterium]
MRNKKIAGCLMALSLCLAAAPVTAFAADDETSLTGTVTTDGGKLNVRSSAGLDGEIITQLADGTEVEVISTEDGWASIVMPESVGYVSAEYLCLSEEDGGAETTETGVADDEAAGDEEESAVVSGTADTDDGETEDTESTGDDALTPDGNLTLVDDVETASESGKQFITVTTKSGNYFYLMIDRDDDGDETVHFLNLVDEADLLALMDEEEAAEYEESVAAAIAEAEATADEETEEAEAEEPAEEKKSGSFAPAVFLLLTVAGAGGAFVFLKQKGSKKAEQEKPDPDADYEEDEEEYDFPEEEEGEPDSSEEEEDDYDYDSEDDELV